VTRSIPRRSLRTLLTEAAPIFALPSAALRQLVGYYDDWRRSRDILNDPDEPPRRRAPRPAAGAHALSSLRPR
jgi:hypothetical protein